MSEPTEAQIVAAARVLNKRNAFVCNVDEEDSWKVYGDAFRDDARAALTFALRAAPSTSVGADGLPELPKPYVATKNDAGARVYFADDMTRYALAALASRPVGDVGADREDAERYRWLRRGRPRTTGMPRAGRIEIMRWEDKSEASILKGDALDAAIDAARTAGTDTAGGV